MLELLGVANNHYDITSIFLFVLRTGGLVYLLSTLPLVREVRSTISGQVGHSVATAGMILRCGVAQDLSARSWAPSLVRFGVMPLVYRTFGLIHVCVNDFTMLIYFNVSACRTFC